MQWINTELDVAADHVMCQATAGGLQDLMEKMGNLELRVEAAKNRGVRGPQGDAMGKKLHVQDNLAACANAAAMERLSLLQVMCVLIACAMYLTRVLS